jgi:hypothetical protein
MGTCVAMGPAIRWRAWLLACLALLPSAARADAPEHELKAQIAVRTLMFTQWPAIVLPPGDALVMCAAENHPWTHAIARQDGQLINGHRLQLRRTTADPARECHVAMISAQKSTPMVQRRPGLLIVGDLQGGLSEGVTLNVQIELGRVVFDINLKAAREDGLDFDARLLRLARFVQKD